QEHEKTALDRCAFLQQLALHGDNVLVLCSMQAAQIQHRQTAWRERQETLHPAKDPGEGQRLGIVIDHGIILEQVNILDPGFLSFKPGKIVAQAWHKNRTEGRITDYGFW